MAIHLILLLLHFVTVVETTPSQTDSAQRLIMFSAKRLKYNKSRFYELNCSSSRQSIGHGAEFIIDGQTVEHIAFHGNTCYNSRQVECRFAHCQCFPSKHMYIHKHKYRNRHAERILGCQMRFTDHATGDIIKAILSLKINETAMEIHAYVVKRLKQHTEKDIDEEKNGFAEKITKWLPAMFGLLLIIIAGLIVVIWCIYRKHDDATERNHRFQIEDGLERDPFICGKDSYPEVCVDEILNPMIDSWTSTSIDECYDRADDNTLETSIKNFYQGGQSKQKESAYITYINNKDKDLATICTNDSVQQKYKSINSHTKFSENSKDEIVCSYSSTSRLYLASKNGQIKVVKELIQHSATVNLSDAKGVTPLSIASEKGHVDIVKELLLHSANVNLSDDKFVTALSIASEKGHVDIVTELLKHSANVNISDEKGITALSIASENGHVGVIKELLKYSANVNISDNNGVTALSIASEKGHVDIVKELLKHLADVNTCNSCGESPLLIAIKKGHAYIVKELVRHTTDVNKCSNGGISPLSIASYLNQIEVVNVLLNCNDIDIDICDEDKHTSLYFASQEGHLDIVKKLLHHSADVDICTNTGVSPLLIAKLRGHFNVVKELLQYSAGLNKRRSIYDHFVFKHVK